MDCQLVMARDFSKWKMAVARGNGECSVNEKSRIQTNAACELEFPLKDFLAGFAARLVIFRVSPRAQCGLP